MSRDSRTQITAVQPEVASSHFSVEAAPGGRKEDLPTPSRPRRRGSTRGTRSTWFRPTSTAPRAEAARLRGVEDQTGGGCVTWFGPVSTQRACSGHRCRLGAPLSRDLFLFSTVRFTFLTQLSGLFPQLSSNQRRAFT